MEKKLLGRCEACGSMYPVAVAKDGTRRVLGNKAQCGCGSRDFRLLNANET